MGWPYSSSFRPKISAQPLQGLPGVDHAGGVVGGVDHHALGVGGEGLLKGGKIDLEVLGLRGDQHHFGPGSLDKHLVLREIGGKHDELVPRAGQPVEHTAEGGRRPHRDVKLIGGIIPAEAAVEGIREALAGRGIPLGAGVAVDQLGCSRRMRMAASLTASGAGTLGLPREKSYTFSRPTTAAR